MRLRLHALRLPPTVGLGVLLVGTVTATLRAADNSGGGAASSVAPANDVRQFNPGPADTGAGPASATIGGGGTETMIIEDDPAWRRGAGLNEFELAPPRIEPLAIYFPPEPPVMGAALPVTGPALDDVVGELVPYLNEPFYAPLSTRLAEQDFGRRHRAQLESYRREKGALLAELRARLASLRGATPAEREKALAALAVSQAPALVELENTADQLRRDFYRRALLGGGGDWNEYRSWNLGDGEAIVSPERAASPLELRVLRAAVFYQEGLSPEQRRLLREVVMELGAVLRPSGRDALPEGASADRVLYFSPTTARIVLPANLPGEVAALVAAYRAEKDALKRELRDRLVLLDRENNASRRVRALSDLALVQAPRFVALESQAEEIRRQLAALPDPREPSAPPALPPALSARIAAYLRAKSDLQRAAQAHLAIAMRDFQRRNAGSPKVVDEASRTAAARAALTRFHEQNKELVEQLNSEGAAIRAEAARALAALGPEGAAGKSVDALLGEFGEAFRRQQISSMYSEYRVAVLEPGLSSEQRRLLFDGALVSLNPPGAVRDQQVPPEEKGGRP